MSFEAWMHEIDLLCLAWYGISIHDLPDMLFRDAYEDGVTAEEFMADHLGSLDALSEHVFG